MANKIKNIIIAWLLLLIGGSVVNAQLRVFQTIQGGTGASSFTPHTLISSGTTSTGALTSTTSITVGYINATSTATSTFGGGINATTGCFAVSGVCVGGTSLLADWIRNAQGNLTPSTSIAVYLPRKLYASSTIILDSSLTTVGSPALWFDGTSNGQIYMKAGSLELTFARDQLDIFGIDDDQLKMKVSGTVAEPSLSFNDGVSDEVTGFFRGGANILAQTSNGKEFWRTDGPALQMIFNEDSNDEDFRFESDGDANNLVSDGGLNRVGVGTSSPWVKFAVNGTSSALGFVSTDATSTGARGWDITGGCFAISGVCSNTLNGGGTGTTSGWAAGGVVFATSTYLTTNPDKFYWDDANGRLGIGNNSPERTLHVSASTTNARDTAGLFAFTPTINVTGAYANYGLQNVITAKIASGVTNTSSHVGGQFAAYRDQASDLGTLAIQKAGWFVNGNVSTMGATGVTTNSYGNFISLYAAAGTISNLYGIYIEPTASGGTLTASYGAYIDPLIGSATTTGLLVNRGDNFFNYGRGSYNFNVRGTSDDNLIFAQASTNRAGIGTSSPGSKFSISGIANFHTATSSLYGTGGIDLAAGCFSITGVCVGGSGLTGSGAANRASFWTTASNLSYDDDFVWNNSTKKLGIGTTTPWAKLSLEMDGTTPAFVVSDQGTTSASIIVLGNGKVGVGTFAPTDGLDIQVASTSIAADSSFSVLGNQAVSNTATGFSPTLTASTTNVFMNVISGTITNAYYLQLSHNNTQFGHAITVRSCTMYFQIYGGVTTAIDVNRWYVVDNTTGTEVNIDNDTTDITSGTSHVSALSNQVINQGEILALEITSKITGAGVPITGTVQIRKVDCTYDTD